MKRLTMLLLLCTSLLVPKTAHADDGGWLDWLYGMDPKLVGVGTDVHLLCLKANGQPFKPCEEWFLIPRLLHLGQSPQPIQIADLKHEVDFRLGFYWKYGDRFSDVADTRSIKALRLMLMYRYHPDVHISVGLGADRRASR